MTLALNPANPTPREIAERVNAILRGKINSIGAVTLTANSASTIVKAAIGSTSVVILFPQTLNGAAELGNGTLYIDPSNYVNNTSFQITHANNSQADRTYGYAILG